MATLHVWSAYPGAPLLRHSISEAVSQAVDSPDQPVQDMREAVIKRSDSFVSKYLIARRDLNSWERCNMLGAARPSPGARSFTDGHRPTHRLGWAADCVCVVSACPRHLFISARIVPDGSKEIDHVPFPTTKPAPLCHHSVAAGTFRKEQHQWEGGFDTLE